ncbi:hypothetical protein [Niastella sp. OAS944]|uniref:hypothetical protein n=1 Tax=Niastella sp. OAS944 TaxID=2664089 RepID=UPI0034823621|nr:hypothetical protein [Chitinophagaceae bacterium OAS944]
MLQRISVALWACVFTCLLFSCKKDNDTPEDPVYNREGVATPVGTVDGTATQKTIGAEGGALTSTDGRIKLTIPAGAVSSAQQFSIQPISNQNPLAVGKAYRLEPHNVTFSKPVTLEFTYTEEDLNNTIPEALGIAYQDDKGVWQAQGSVTTDLANRKVKVATTHFSDWSLFESFYLISSASTLPTNGTADLEVFTTEDILEPLVPGQQVPMGKKISVATTNIKEWKLAGAGNLQPNGAKAVYKAPATVPAINPVAISVSLDFNKRGKYLLVKHINITGDDGEIEVRVAGGAWVKQPASPAVKMGPDNIAMADSDGDENGWYVLIRFVGGVGTHPFKDPTAIWGTHVHYHITGGNNYTCAYIKADGEFVASGGGVTITSMGDDDGFIKGTFLIQPAGYGDNLRQTATVEGKFRVRKSW